jgi:alanine-alpha-ketoisovalerate/valine-pyruvate aminotransferase
MDYEKLNSPTPISTEQTASPFKWNSSDTDFLELFAALYQNESIVRADGKPLTRKEMQDYFQSILGLEIKDVEGKLTKAGNRNDNTAFLDALAQEFRNYVSGKEKKLKGRK